ncbi:MAG: hypothetical protein QNJ77_05755 [Acidimicrobiia bacterium]|nr:hypothetical protein [Acidimicrobiia bacterium]
MTSLVDDSFVTSRFPAALPTLVAVLLALAVAGCGDDAVDAPPFKLAEGEVGCRLVFGSTTGRAIGPLEPGDSETLHPNEFSEVHVGVSPTTLIVRVDRTVAASAASIDLEEIPDEGFDMEGAWIDSAHPGYVITCFRG